MRGSRPILLLNGFMGTGKSTVGRKVAERTGVPFVDLDEQIEAEAGKPVQAIFRDAGEPAFRALEADALRRALDGSVSGQGCVVALGGGSLLDATRRREALGRAFVATLLGTPETLAQRTAGSARPLLAGTRDPAARIKELMAARAAVYAEAHVRISTDGRSPDVVAEAVLEAWSRHVVAVPLGERSYAVQFATGSADVVAAEAARIAPSAVYLVTDANVAPRWGGPLEEALGARGLRPRATVVLTPGEEHKRLGAVEQALLAMVEAGADRSALVIGHGGGVVTDIAGFCAATLLRGVRWMALPTTLLSMVDASVGGKTGVDLGLAKNAVGAFHQPSSVVIDVAKVATEGARAYRSGLAEVVKSGCIGDPGLLDRLEANVERVLAREPGMVEEITLRSVAVKATIVARDETETGERALLNFGHTVGHALEAEGGFTRLTHGEAVSLGMVAMLRIGRALGLTDAADAERVVQLLGRLGLPVELDAGALKRALPLISLDKKRCGGTVKAVVMYQVGDTKVHPLSLSDFPALLGLSGDGVTGG